MSHPYKPICDCSRCIRERNRRAEQSAADPRKQHYNAPKPRRARERRATREEQHARYIDCGPGAWDDRGDY